MNEESQVSGCCNITFIETNLDSPESNALVPSQVLKLNDLLLQGNWGLKRMWQIIRAIKLLPNQKRKDDRKKVKGSWPGTCTIHLVTPPLNHNQCPR